MINKNKMPKSSKTLREPDEEGGMAHVELKSIDRSVKELQKIITKREQQLPAWVQSKITRAADYMNAASEYLQSDDLKEASFEINKDEHKNANKTATKKEKISRLINPENPGESAAAKAALNRLSPVQLPNISRNKKSQAESVSLVNQILSEMECECELKKHSTPEKIAKKHGVSLQKIQKELKMGIQVEKEHTNDLHKAETIALQHLNELPNYYTKLKKVETPVKESVSLPRQSGNILNVILTWRGKNIVSQVFFPSLKIPNRKEVEYEMQKIYPDCKILNFKVSDQIQNQPLIQITNPRSKNYLLNNKTIGEEFEQIVLNEFRSAAWQRKEGKNKTGGLNRKGIAAYRRENPGSKLSMAVTTKPSKLKKGSKKYKRRKSFCARMGGMPGPMKDEKGRPTRKALALRKWNC